MLPLVIAVMVVDVSSQFTPRTRIAEAVHTVNYGILLLVTTSLCGAIAAYALQRLAFPLQDQNMASIDAALAWIGRLTSVGSIGTSSSSRFSISPITP